MPFIESFAGTFSSQTGGVWFIAIMTRHAMVYDSMLSMQHPIIVNAACQLQ